MNTHTRYLAGAAATCQVAMQVLSRTTAAHLVRVRHHEPAPHGRDHRTVTQTRWTLALSGVGCGYAQSIVANDRLCLLKAVV